MAGLPTSPRPLARRLPARRSRWYLSRYVDNAKVSLGSRILRKHLPLLVLSRCLRPKCPGLPSGRVRAPRRSTILYSSGREALSTVTKRLPCVVRAQGKSRSASRGRQASRHEAVASERSQCTAAVFPVSFLLLSVFANYPTQNVER